MGGELVAVPHGDGPLLVPGEVAALQVAQVLRVLGDDLVLLQRLLRLLVLGLALRVDHRVEQALEVRPVLLEDLVGRLPHPQPVGF